METNQIENLETLISNLTEASIVSEQVAETEKTAEGEKADIDYFTGLYESFSKTVGRLNIKVAKLKAKPSAKPAKSPA